ncbi:MAG: ankyrin repeat domain-containing protein [Gammaproteobacteria bacterium]|nr:ankyrin repeat domain-containing protein [Gammaproteobacteria bacterium]
MHTPAPLRIFLIAALCVTPLLLGGCDDNTPLMNEVVNGDRDAVEKSLAEGGDINERNNFGWTALMHAARQGHTELVKLLIEKGADVNAQDQDQWSALIRASMKGNLQAAQLLLDNGADPNMKTNVKWTALHWAAASDHLAIVKLLVANGADVTLTNDEGRRASELAFKEQNGDIVSFLRKKEKALKKQSAQ